MEDSCVLNLASQSSILITNYYSKQNEVNDSYSSQGTNNQGEIGLNQNDEKKKIQSSKKKINKDLQQNLRKNQGHWTAQEHQIYVEFLEQHHNTDMQSQQNRKNNKIFKLMSLTIGTRSPSQCRSHHQKFNPFTTAGQKRNKRCRKRINAENQLIIDQQQYYTPEVKPLIEHDLLMHNNEYFSNYEESHPQLQNYCCNSNFDQESAYRQNSLHYIEQFL